MLIWIKSLSSNSPTTLSLCQNIEPVPFQEAADTHILCVLPVNPRKPFVLSAKPANDFENRPVYSLLNNMKWGHFMSGNSVLENVRLYRSIASICRQTAVFRPAQKWSLLAQAYEYERLAITELEADFTIRDCAPRWDMAVAA